MNRIVRAFPGRLGGALFGAALAGLFQALSYPGLDALELIREKLLLIWSGDFVIALVVAVLVLAAGAIPAGRDRLAARGAAVAAAAAFALASAPGWAFTVGAELADRLEVGVFGKPVAWGWAACAALIGTLVPLALRLRLPQRALAAAGGFALLIFFVLMAVPAPETGAEASAPPLPPAALDTAAGDGPDIVLFSIDTLRADAVAAGGLELPGVAALRARGRTGAYALAPAPSTLPSHTSMLSGVDILGHGARGNEYRVPERLPMLAEMLRMHGWRTAAVVSNGVIRGAAGFARGFEVYDDSAVSRGGAARLLRNTADAQTWLGWLLSRTVVESEFRRHAFGAKPGPESADEENGAGRGERTKATALAYLRQLQTGQAPFFLFVHFMDPHQPYRPHESVRGRLADPSELPERFQREDDGSLALAKRVEQALRGGAGDAPAAAEYLHRVYLEEVLYVDQCLQELLAQIDASGRETVILFTADHGEQFGEHDLMLHANSLYEPLVRVPMILAGPGIEAGSVFAVVPQLEDVAPTLLSFAGVPRAGRMDGRDLREIAPPPRPHVAVRNQQLAFRSGDWKLIGRMRESEAGTIFLPEELYDLAQDPDELHNAIEERVEEVARLRKGAEAAMALAVAGELADLDSGQRAMLEELGYVLGTESGGEGH
ncbi:MAG TPA: sulfatase [Planctomycetota bacterium]